MNNENTMPDVIWVNNQSMQIVPKGYPNSTMYERVERQYNDDIAMVPITESCDE